MTPPTPAFLATACLGRPLRYLATGALVLVLAACATRVPAPVVERAPPTKVGPAEVAPAPGAPGAAGTPGTPEPDWRPPTYTVKRGDTLHQIALDYGLDYRELAAWNNIDNPNVIRVGQVVRLSAPGEPGSAPAGPGVTVTPLRAPPPVVAGEARAPVSPPPVAAGPRNSDNYKSQPKALKEPYSEQALREVQRLTAAAPPPAESAPAPAAPPTATPPAATPPAVTPPVAGPPAGAPPAGASPAMAGPAVAAPAPGPAPPVAPTVVARADTKLEAPRADAKPQGASDDDRIDWLWPATGKLVTGFSDTANLKGIDIAGKAGQPVVASAGGKVVYAGTGLRGYGKLVIVKHNNTFLSAYAHNSDILVKEGQQVTRGQKIAEMGNTDSDQVKLHFEIRRLGKPVDPLKYLPPA